MHSFEPLIGIERVGFAHQIGEVVFQAGGAHAMRPGAHGVSDGPSDGAYGRFAVEPAENVAGTEADEQAVHLWKHVGGEEGDGDGVPVFEVEPHIRWQVGAHLLKRVSVAGFEP